MMDQVIWKARGFWWKITYL